MNIELLGYFAAVLTTVSGIPQFIKIMKDKSAKEVSLLTYIILFIGVSLWLVYGLFLNSKPIILANSITSVIYALVIFSKIYYSKVSG